MSELGTVRCATGERDRENKRIDWILNRNFFRKSNKRDTKIYYNLKLHNALQSLSVNGYICSVGIHFFLFIFLRFFVVICFIEPNIVGSGENHSTHICFIKYSSNVHFFASAHNIGEKINFTHAHTHTYTPIMPTTKTDSHASIYQWENIYDLMRKIYARSYIY